MQLIRVPNGNLIPGHPIESDSWNLMRENQNEIYGHDGAIIPGLVGGFRGVYTEEYPPPWSQKNDIPDGLDLDTWSPVIAVTRPLADGAAFTLHMVVGFQSYEFRIVVRKVAGFSNVIMGTFDFSFYTPTNGNQVHHFIVPGVVSGDILTFEAFSRDWSGEGEEIHQFFLREKIATEAEIP